MFWMVVLCKFNANYDHALDYVRLKHNLSYDEAVRVCDSFREVGFPTFLVRQDEYHDYTEIPEDCPDCLGDLHDIFDKHGVFY